MTALDQAADLHARAFAGQSNAQPWTARTLHDLLQGRGAFALALQAEDTLFGLLLARRVLEECEILTLAVDPARRRCGGAALLLTAAIDRVFADGGRQVLLEVAEDNQAAIGFYRHSGFRIVGRRPGYYRRSDGVLIAAHIMRRDLAMP